ncbi:MAG: hypothetical protein AAF615_06960 [Pseudomonadota bacterium]
MMTPAARSTPQSLTPAHMPVRKSIRRLRWFIAAFEQQVDEISKETGSIYRIEANTLAQVFVEWIRAFEAQKPKSDEDRLAYVGFAAGLMLRTLVRRQPLKLVSTPEGHDYSKPAYYWPEGYAYVVFCLNIRALVLEQDFREKQEVVPALSEAGTWWSFKENVQEDSNLAIAFLDLFAGSEPDWGMPEKFVARPSRTLPPSQTLKLS